MYHYMSLLYSVMGCKNRESLRDELGAKSGQRDADCACEGLGFDGGTLVHKGTHLGGTIHIIK